MRFHLRCQLCLLAGLLLISCVSALAQTNPNLAIGLTPYQSYESGNIDSVNLLTGNLNVHIPLFSYPQRGSLQNGYAVTYNDKNWFVWELCNQPEQPCRLQWRFASWNPGGIGLASEPFTTVSWAPLVPHQASATIFTAHTADGGGHLMLPDNAGGYRTVDGSGIWYNGATTQLPETTKTRDGITYNFTQSGTAIEDPNGNYSDSLGRASLTGATYTSDYTGCVAPAAPAQISSAVIDTLPGQNNGSRSIKICTASYNITFSSGGVVTIDAYGNSETISDGSATVTLVVSVVSYNGSSWATSQAWGFDYSSAGSLAKIAFPTGGTISYTWGGVQVCPDYAGLTPYGLGVTSRTVNAQDGTGPHTTYYGIGNTFSVVTDPSLNDTVHVFTDLVSQTCSLYETQTKYYQGPYTTGALLKTVNTDYTWTANPYAAHMTPPSVINVRPIRRTTIWPNGQTTKVEKDYDTRFKSNSYTLSYFDVTAVREYNYGNGSPGPLLRTTTNTYLPFTNSSYLKANLLDLLSSSAVTNGSGAQVAKTTYGYDGLTLQSAGITIQRDSTFNTTSPGIRGNLTSVCRWLNTSGGNLCASTTYYDTGMPYLSADPAGNKTTYSYSSAYDGAYLTQTNYPDTGSPAIHHVISGTYDFNTGSLLTFTDQNGKVSSYGYDALGRITSATFPDWGQQTITRQETTYPFSATLTQKITSSQNLVGTNVFDGLGRVIQTQLNSDPDCPSGDKTDTTYDALGRVFTVSNPYCVAGETTSGLTTYTYDALGRTTKVAHPDNTTALTTYTGSAAQVQDEGNGTQRVQRISQTDALRRLASVCEVSGTTLIGSSGTPAPCGLAIGGTGFLTSYQYDLLDNLLQVSQPGITARTFVYDSLSRLTSATNPESGTTTYSYDLNGNLLKKTDARGTATTFAYDAMNRLTSKTYGDTTPGVTNTYDAPVGGLSITNPVGRLVKAATNDGLTATVNSYDPMGRINNQWQCTPQNCGAGYFSLPYVYDLLGDITSAGNGMGVTLTYNYPAGRLTQITSSLSDSNHPASLLSGVHYNAPGAITSGAFGNGASESFGYDSRLRPTSATTNGSAASSGSTGSAAVSGNEQSIPGASTAPGTGAVTFSGTLQSKQMQTQPPATGTGSVTLSGALQSKQIQTQAATSGSGSVTYSGTLQSKQVQTQAATPGVGSVTISGSEQSFHPPDCPANNLSCRIYDFGTIYITVNGFSKSYNYGQGSTTSTIATALANLFNGDSASPVTASANLAVVTLTAKATGTASNYSLSSGISSYDTGDFVNPSFAASPSGASLTGGSNAVNTTQYDSGTSTINVNGHGNTVSWSGSGTTATSIASSLASNINGDAGASVSASVSGSTVSLTAKSTGASTNYSLASSGTYDSADFSGSSFNSSNSGAALAGGVNAVNTTQYDTGASTITVNGHSDTVSWSGSATTTASIASALAANINADSGASVTATASGSTVSMTAKTTGASTNYSLASSWTYDSTDFSSASFTSTNSGAALAGGADAVNTTQYDSGTSTITVNGHSDTVSWSGSATTTASIASALAANINADSAASASASASGSTVNLTAKSTGSATNYSLSSSSTYDSSNFTSASFTSSNSGAALTGGHDTGGTTYDSGSVWITVNGTQYSVSYGQNSTATSLASSLAQAINGSSGSPVTATASSTAVSLSSRGTGSSTNYSLSVGSSTSQSSSFSQPSFTVAASGGSMTGGANGAPATLYSFSLGYAPDSNVTTANDSVNGNWTYSYDAFNRLVGSNQNGGAAIYSYDYDRFGNRWHQNGPNSMMLSFSGSNNRMDGYSYDAAGNLVVDNVNNRYTYDAEGRIVMVVSPVTGTSCYVYNADGQRVRKTTGSTNSCGTPATGTSVDYLYDLAGNEITELSSTGSWNRGEVYATGQHLATYNLGTTYFNHSDWLGTERVRSNISSASCETITSLPFGDGQTISGSCTDPSPVHFTGQERDTESGLDNFGARYFGSSMGRFMSPDPYNAGAFLGAPQSWNAYSYVLNNPLNATDPNGLDCVYFTGGDSDPHQGWIKSGDCINETDNGYYVDGSINGARYTDANNTVDLSTAGIGFDQNNNWAGYAFTPYDTPFMTSAGAQCIGDCSDSVQVTAAPPGTPTMSAAPYPGLLTPSPQISFKPPTTFWERLAVAAGCTLGLDAELMDNGFTPNNGNDRPEESQFAMGKYKVPFRRGTPGRPPEMNKSGKKSAEAMNAAAGGVAMVGNQQACLQNASGQR